MMTMKVFLFTGACCSLYLSQPLLAGGEVDAATEIKTDKAESSGSWVSEVIAGQGRLDMQFESLHSSDIDIEQYSIQFELRKPIWNFSLLLGYTDYEEQYRPAVIGTNTVLTEQSKQIQAQVGAELGGGWRIDGTARYYDGYSGYRSIWIAEYYRQLFGPIPGYIAPDPKGYSYSVGATYTYIEGHSLRASVGYGRDVIAPGYTFGGSGLSRSRPTLFRKSSTLRFEDVWTRWLKSEHTISYLDVTSRDYRWQVKSTWHAALGDDWTLRLNVGYSEEGSDFEAEYGGISLEWNFAGNWHISANADIYRDTGEIPNAGLVSTSAPAIKTIQYGIGLRWVGENSAFRIFAAMYENDYDALSPGNQIFRNLYQNRDWTLVQLSYTYNF